MHNSFSTKKLAPSIITPTHTHTDLSIKYNTNLNHPIPTYINKIETLKIINLYLLSPPEKYDKILEKILEKPTHTRNKNNITYSIKKAASYIYIN